MKLPARPRLKLYAPKKLVSGSEATIAVELDSPRATPVDYVDLIVVGRRFWSGTTRETLRLGARLSGPGRLPKGKSELSCRIPLPPDAPPTFAGRLAAQRYEAHVHVSVPYWPDARAQFQLVVRPPDRPPSTGDALLFATRAGGAPASGPYAELSLGTRAVAPGDGLRGAVALFNVAQSGYARVVVSLVELEMETAGNLWSVTLEPAQFVEGGRLDFALKVPELAPSHAVGGFVVRHELRVTAHSTFRELLAIQVPIDVLPASTGETSAPVIHALGEERIERVFREVAAERGVALEGGALVHQAASVTVRVWREPARETPRLVAELRHAPLGLSLRSEPRRGLGRLLRGGLRAGWPPLDPLRCEARDPEQGERWLRTLTGALAAVLPRDVVIDALGDDALALSVADSGTSRESIGSMLDAAIAAAHALHGVLGEVPLPSALAEREAEWIALATRLGGVLTRGTGTVRREDEGQRLEVRLEDPGPGVRVILGDDGLRVNARWARAPEEAAPLGKEAVRAAVPLLTDWAGLEARVGLRDGELVLIAEGEALPPRLADRVDRAVLELGRLLEAVRGVAGPFR